MRSSAFAPMGLLAVLLSLFVASTSVTASGWSQSPVLPLERTPLPEPLVPPRPPVPIGPVRIALYRVSVAIEDQVATTQVEQTFVNDSDVPLEGTYLFPLPAGAAISEFNMVVDGQTVEGQILRQEQARAVYESIVRQQRDPALLEFVGQDLLQARVFPIPPGGQRKIEFTYSQVLPKEGGLIHYRYPLTTAHLSRLPVDQLALSVHIQSGTALKAIYSPSHPVVVAREGDREAWVGYEATGVVPNTDFDLYFSVGDDEVSVSLLTYKPEGEDGFFLLLAVPPLDVEQERVVARDIVLVLDTSGSMEGRKMDQARRALLYVLDRLNPRDRFNVIAFSTGVRQFDSALAPAVQATEARRFVERLEAGGGTDINRALLEALAQADDQRPTVIIFLTDGLPTEGVVEPQIIIDNVRQSTGENVQIFTFGVGDDVNTVLLDTISQENGGASAYVRPDEAIDELVSGFYAKVSTPVLTDLAADVSGVLMEDSFPYPLPDLFAGSQLVVAGRYRQGGPAALTLTGVVNGQERVYVYDDLTFKRKGGEPFIARLWAMRKIGHLLSEIRLRGVNPEFVDEIIRLSTRYGIATPYTSFFVPEPEVAMPPLPPARPGIGGGGTLPEPTLQPMLAEPQALAEVQKQVEAQAEAALQAVPAAPTEGRQAVEDSQAREALRSASSVSDTVADSGLRYAQDKAFVLRAGLWVDTSYESELPRLELAFGSDAYFDLLAEHPQWATYFAVSPNLIVVLDGTAYVVTESEEDLMPAAPPPTPIPGLSSTPVGPGEPGTSPGAGPTATAEAPAVALAPSQAGQPSPSTFTPAPFCTAPLIGVGLLLIPGVWAWRRRR